MKRLLLLTLCCLWTLKSRAEDDPEWADVCGIPGCPSTVRYLRNFNLWAGQGAYFVHFMTQNQTIEGCDGGCWSLYLPLKSENELGFVPCCQKEGYPYCGDGIGGGTLKNSETHPGRLTYSTGGVDYNAFVLGTSYDRYLVLATCGLLADGTPYQTVFGLTRTPAYPPHFYDLVTGAYLSNGGFDVNIAVPTYQGHDCFNNLGCQ